MRTKVHERRTHARDRYRDDDESRCPYEIMDRLGAVLWRDLDLRVVAPVGDAGFRQEPTEGSTKAAVPEDGDKVGHGLSGHACLSDPHTNPSRR